MMVACELLPETTMGFLHALYIVPTRLISTVAVDGFIGFPFSSFGFQNDPISFTPALATWEVINQEDLTMQSRVTYHNVYRVVDLDCGLEQLQLVVP